MGNLIAKENALIEANHRLGEVEQRLVLLAISYTRLHNEQYDPALQRIHEKHYNSWTKRSKFFMNLAIKFRRWSKSGDLLNPNHRVDVGCETMKEVKECQ